MKAKNFETENGIKFYSKKPTIFLHEYVNIVSVADDFYLYFNGQGQFTNVSDMPF